MKSIFCILFLLVLTIISCSYSHEQKNRNNKDYIFSILNNDTLFKKACNEDPKYIVENNPQYQYFIVHLFCNQPCHNRWSLNEDYFGNGSIEDRKINIYHIPSTIGNYNLIPKEELLNYILNAWNFLLENSDSLTTKKHLNVNCFAVNLFFISLRSMREDNYSNMFYYSDFLMSVYNRFIKYDVYLADMVLNVMRYDSNKSIKSFLAEKKFQSKEFNSTIFLDRFSNENNVFTDYQRLVRN